MWWPAERRKSTEQLRDDDGATIYDADGRPLDPDELPATRVGETGDPVFNEEFVLERPDGERTWLSVNAAPVFGPDGDLERVITTGEDITELKERERGLETELSEVFGRVSDAFYALDEEYRFTHVNERAEELLQHTEEELLGENLWEMFPEAAEEDAVWEAFHTAMETQEATSYELYYEPLDFWVEANVYPSESGVSVYFRDVTERVEREQALRESERRYRTLAEEFPNGAVSVYADDLRIELTQGSVLGESLPARDRIEGRTIAEVYPDHVVEDLDPLLRAAVEEGETGRDQFEFGGRVWQVWATPLRDATGDVFAGLSFAQDITEQVEREHRLEETVKKLEESNERLERFASMLAHELRNPVTIGQIYSQQLPADADDEAVEYVTDAFDRIEDMVDVMLVLTRGRDAVDESSRVDVATVAREAWDDLDAPGATLEVPTDHTIRADETYVRHLIENLLENAVEHGSTSPRSQAHEDAIEHGGDDLTVTVGDLPTGFYVADDGEGIPADERDAVFDAGYTSAAGQGGTGLGLAFVQELADVYEWDCEVTESDAGGARFEFTNVDRDSQSD